MKVVRILVWLFAALALAMPPVAVQAAPVTWHAGSHHADGQHADGQDAGGKCAHHGAAKHVGNLCCMSAAPCVLAVAEASIVPMAPVDRSVTGGVMLHGLTFTKDPPPPRI
jgi:hypothetical protein